MIEIHPRPNETPLAFIERADALEVADEVIDAMLKEHFGIRDDGELKELKLKSVVFWKKFVLSHISEIHQKGGSRYAAMKFIEKKNGQCGQRPFSEKQIEELVDSVGVWQQ